MMETPTQFDKWITDINECMVASPCLHGGSCFNTMGSFRCTCPPQWTGERCETGQWNYEIIIIICHN